MTATAMLRIQLDDHPIQKKQIKVEKITIPDCRSEKKSFAIACKLSTKYMVRQAKKLCTTF